MPEEMERRLKAEAKAKGLKGEEFNRYVYGTMRKKAGWKPEREKGKKSAGKKRVKRKK